MEMRCYHKILHISYKDHVTNEEVRAKIQQSSVTSTCVVVVLSAINCQLAYLEIRRIGSIRQLSLIHI